MRLGGLIRGNEDSCGWFAVIEQEQPGIVVWGHYRYGAPGGAYYAIRSVQGHAWYVTLSVVMVVALLGPL